VKTGPAFQSSVILISIRLSIGDCNHFIDILMRFYNEGTLLGQSIKNLSDHTDLCSLCNMNKGRALNFLYFAITMTLGEKNTGRRPSHRTNILTSGVGQLTFAVWFVEIESLAH